MDIFVIEAPGKVASVKRLIRESGYARPFEVVATSGKLLDLPDESLGINTSLLPSSWVKRKPALFNKLKSKLSQAEAVFLLTDPDYEGEFIAWLMVNTMKIKDWKRLYLPSLSSVAFQNALDNASSTLDERKVRAVFVRRGIDRYLGYAQSPINQHGYRYPMGTVITPLCNVIAKGEFKVGELVHRCATDHPHQYLETRVDVPRNKVSDAHQLRVLLESLDLDAINRSETTFTPADENPSLWTGGEALVALSKRFNKPVEQIYQEMQSAYEQGYISYVRTDSHRISSESLKASREVAFKQGIRNAPRKMKKLLGLDDDGQPLEQQSPLRAPSLAAQEGHEALHVIKSPPLHLDERYLGPEERIAKAIWEHFVEQIREDAPKQYVTEALLAKIGSRARECLHKLTDGKPIKWMLKRGAMPSKACEMVWDQDDQMIVNAMLRNELGRPSSFVGHALKLVKHLWSADDKGLNRKGDAVLQTALQHCPGLTETSVVRALHQVLDDHAGRFSDAASLAREVVNLLELNIHLPDDAPALRMPIPSSPTLHPGSDAAAPSGTKHGSQGTLPMPRAVSIAKLPTRH